MRVIVNALSVTSVRSGVGHYTGELLRHMSPLVGADHVDAFPGFWLRQAQRVWAAWRNRSAGVLGASGTTRLREGTLPFLQRAMSRACRGYDLYHEPNFVPLATDIPVIATIHDLSLCRHPEWHPAHRVAHFERHFREALRHCVHILTVSEFSRREIIELLGVPPERVTRTHLGIRPNLLPLSAERVRRSLQHLKLPPRYLLYLGTIEPRKNIALLLEAYLALPAALRATCPLVLAGGWGWNSAHLRPLLADAEGKGVRYLGYAPEGGMAALYNGARALVYPSLYEGFGLPPVEMLACGGAVIASTAAATVETVGRQAHLVDPHDVHGWREALLRVITDDDWWRSLRANAQASVRDYSWERCARETLALYREVHASRRAPAQAA